MHLDLPRVGCGQSLKIYPNDHKCNSAIAGLSEDLIISPFSWSMHRSKPFSLILPKMLLRLLATFSPLTFKEANFMISSVPPECGPGHPTPNNVGRHGVPSWPWVEEANTGGVRGALEEDWVFEGWVLTVSKTGAGTGCNTIKNRTRNSMYSLRVNSWRVAVGLKAYVLHGLVNWYNNSRKRFFKVAVLLEKCWWKVYLGAHRI